MERIETTYKKLTGIDIAQQARIWDERGKGYYGEYLLFSELYPQITGSCKILMNLQIPSEHEKTTEIDLVLIHETGFYLFEVKHYKGTIYGKADDKKWTQYFRTTKNEQFYNPIAQNQLHIRALQKMFPEAPMHSCIVFTNPECEVKVHGELPSNVTVSKIEEVIHKISPKFNRPRIFDIDKIDSLFHELRKYSPAQEEIAVVNDDIIPFTDYIQILHQDYEKLVNKQKEHFDKKEKEQEAKFLQNTKEQEAAYAKKKKKIKRRAIFFSICWILICIVACSVITEDAWDRVLTAEQNAIAAETELARFAQKFEHVNEFNDGNLIISERLIEASDVVLKPSSDILNAVNFSCRLTSTSSVYGISIGEDAAVIVILKDGSVKEYDLWNETYPYHGKYYVGTGTLTQASVGMHEFYNIDIEDIAYIKLSNLGVWSTEAHSHEDIATGYEVELYHAANS